MGPSHMGLSKQAPFQRAGPCGSPGFRLFYRETRRNLPPIRKLPYLDIIRNPVRFDPFQIPKAPPKVRAGYSILRVVEHNPPMRVSPFQHHLSKSLQKKLDGHEQPNGEGCLSHSQGKYKESRTTWANLSSGGNTYFAGHAHMLLKPRRGS